MVTIQSIYDTKVFRASYRTGMFYFVAFIPRQLYDYLPLFPNDFGFFFLFILHFFPAVTSGLFVKCESPFDPRHSCLLMSHKSVMRCERRSKISGIGEIFFYWANDGGFQCTGCFVNILRFLNKLNSPRSAG